MQRRLIARSDCLGGRGKGSGDEVAVLCGDIGNLPLKKRSLYAARLASCDSIPRECRIASTANGSLGSRSGRLCCLTKSRHRGVTSTTARRRRTRAAQGQCARLTVRRGPTPWATLIALGAGWRSTGSRDGLRSSARRYGIVTRRRHRLNREAHRRILGESPRHGETTRDGPVRLTSLRDAHNVISSSVRSSPRGRGRLSAPRSRDCRTAPERLDSLGFRIGGCGCRHRRSPRSARTRPREGEAPAGVSQHVRDRKEPGDYVNRRRAFATVRLHCVRTTQWRFPCSARPW